MTILGFHVASPRRAIVWSDSETYRDGEPTGDAVKLALNPLAALVGVGSGRVGVLYAAAAELIKARSLDGLACALPDVLRSASADFETSDAWASHAVYCAVGHSERFGRIVGQVFAANCDFEPNLSAGWLAPQPAAAGDIVVDHWSAIATAYAQLAELQKLLPRATGRRLTVAEIDSGRLIVQPASHFNQGCASS